MESEWAVVDCSGQNRRMASERESNGKCKASGTNAQWGIILPLPQDEKKEETQG